MGLLKDGEQVCIFPEGTRVSAPDAVVAKVGAVRIAMRLGVPIIPAFITRNKKLFRKVDVVVGEPYYISADADPQQQTEELMQRIEALDPGKEQHA
jgi:1-acyl-sn-glycerol-3-phosphate acyltransferase